MAEEIVNEEDQVVDEEEEEDNRETDDRQNLDDLTVLNEENQELDDPEGLHQDNDPEWEEPVASNTMSVIHTGSRPTDAELLANLAPEGEVIIEEGEIVPPDELAGLPLPEVDSPESERPDRELATDAATGDGGDAAPFVPAANEGLTSEPLPEDPTVIREAEPAEVVQDDTGGAGAAAAAEPVAPVAPLVAGGPDDADPEEDPNVETSAAPTVSVEESTGGEDSEIPLVIDPAGAGEVVIGNVPEGAVLSNGTDNGDGTWTLTAAELEGLTITPPANSDEDFSLSVTADGVTVNLEVAIEGVADTVSAAAQSVTGQEDTAINLDLRAALTDVDGSETLSVTISGVPDGATLNAGVDNGDGTWTVDPTDLSGLALTPPPDFAGDIPLTLISTSTETGSGDSATTEVPFTVTVSDTVDAENAATLEDTAVALTIDPGDAAEVVISDVPESAVFSAGVQNNDGTWTLQAADLEGLTLTPPANSDADFTLTITGDGFAETMDVSVAAVADTPTVGASDEVGTQDTPIPLDLSAGLTDTDGSESLSIALSGIPEGAVVSAGGTDLQATNGTVALTADQLASISITAPEGYFGSFDLQLTSTATDTDQDSGNTDVATNSTTFTVTVNEAGEFSVVQSEGLEDTAIGLTIDPGNATSVTIENLPEGAILSAGTEVNGVWTVDAADLVGLTVTPPENSDADFTLAVTADGVTQNLDVVVNAEADAPTATAGNVAGIEDTAIALDLGAALTDTDLSETLSITITGVPDGTVFSSGTNNNDGTWTIDPADLNGLTMTPPANFYGEIPLGLTATATEADGGDTATTSVPFSVTVASDGDFGTAAATGLEDTAINLDIDVSTIDATEVVISDVPNGAVLSAGVDNGDGTWTLAVADVAGLQITPPADSDADFILTVTADGISEPLSVTVLADADAPVATAGDVVGDEDTPVGLDLATALSDVDGSEVLSVTISGVPTGATFSSGTNNGDGTWSIDPADLAGLTINPPLNFEGPMGLTLNATSTETDGGDTETTSVPFTVTFTPDPNEPNFVVVGAAGNEDTAIPLEIDPGTASEVIISNIPDGAVFSAGTDNGDGTWTVLADDLAGLTVTPPVNSDADFTLSVSATDADGVTAVGNLDVAVHAVADAPDLDVTSSIGLEDSSIPLDISSALNDADGSETLSMTINIQGVPDGSVLSAGTDNGDGTWSLTSADLEGLTITPPADYFGDMTLQVTSTATETNPSEAGDVAVSSATSTASFGVTVRPVADNPELNLVNVTGSEDTAIALNIGANMGDTTEDLSTLNISGVPSGATLSAGSDLGNGVWSFSAEELAAGALDSLTLTPPADYNGDFTLTVSAFSTDGGVAVQQMNVDVEAVSDLDITNIAAGLEDTAISLNITAAADETVTIADVPEGAVLSAGVDNGDGSWSLTAADLEGLTITPPADSDVDFSLSVYAGAVDGTPDGTIAVTVDPDADVPSLDLTAAVGLEDTSIALEIDPGLGDTDGSEVLSISIADIPVGASLSFVNDLGATESIPFEGNSATLTTDQLNGLTLTPPANFNGSFDLSVTATATELADGSEFEVTAGTLSVDVGAVADLADVSAADVAGLEDGTVALNIGATGDDTILSITIADVPAGATLSAGVDNGDGSWTLAPEDLTNLSLSLPENSDVDFALSVTATTADGGDTATSDPVPLNVSVAADADVPTLDLSLALGNEDTAIALDIDPGLTDTDGSETLSISIGDIPEGASLNFVNALGETEAIEITGTTATLTPEQLNGLTITPPANFDGTFDLSVSATATETDGGDFETTTGTLTVDVAAIADEAVITAQQAVGVEDQAIPLSIEAISDDDITSIVISGVPDGAALSAGINNGDGTWTLNEADLTGLTVTPPADSSVDFQLGVAVTTSDGADTTTTTGTLDVSVTGDADAPSLNLFAALGDEDTAIPLQINTGLSDTDGSETLSILISDVPAGATLNNGTLVETDPDTGAQTWSLQQTDLTGLTITPALDSSDAFDLTVAVTATEADGDTETTSGTLSVAVDGVADVPTLDLTTPVVGTEDTAIPLSIDAGLTDGSETLSIAISNIPDGASLTYVDENGLTQTIDITAGSAELTAGQLNGLAITPPADSADDFQLSVVATSVDGTDTATKGGVLDVSVTGDADTPTLNLSDVSGVEDTAIALNIDTALTDTDGSETLSVTISDVPAGASLSAGLDNGDGTWTLTADDLDGLTLTPPAGFDGTINLGVTSTATEADGDVASTATQTLSVAVADSNVGPVASDDTFSGTEDGTITFTAEQLLANDTDGNNDALTITDFAQPDNGTLVSDGNGTFTFTPDADWSGETSFTYTVSDGQGGTSQATVTLDVDGIADAPVISDAVAGGDEDTAIALTLDPALTDTDGSETLSISIGDIPAGATLNYVNGQGGTETITITDGTAQLTTEQLNGLTITPPENANGTINLNVTATATEADGGTASTTSTLTVDVAAVNDGPIAGDDQLSGLEDQAFTFSAEQLLANDTDVDGDTLTVQSVDQPDFGTIVDNGDGTYTFTPDENWSGQTEFTYTATDGQGGTSQGTVSVNIGEFNEGPVATDDSLSGTEDGTITFFPADLLANDTDADGDTLSITGFEQPANGAIVENPDGSFTFTPDANWSGETNFTYTISDGQGGTSQATVTIDVDGIADAPVMSDATVGGNEDTAIALNIDPGLTDTDGSETLSITLGDIPAGATLNYVDSAGVTQAITVTDGAASLTSDQLNGLTLTPPENVNGTIDLSVSATTTEADGGSATTNTTLSVDVAAVNDGPIAGDDQLSGFEDQAFTFSAEQLLANDTDVDGDTLTVQSVDQPDFGTIVDNGDGTYTFTPDENWSGQTEFTYTATDGQGGTSQGTVSVNIGDVNEGPVAADDTLGGSEDQPLTFSAADLLANDTDADGDTLSITGFEQPDNGTIVDNGDGTFTFTPDANWSGDTSFTYTISDGAGGTSQASVTIGVDGVADAPNVAMADVTGLEDTAITLNIDPSLVDTDGSESLSISIGDIPDGATLAYVDGNGDLQPITVTEGSADLSTDQLNGLQITPANNFDGSFDLSVSATATENDATGDTATTIGTLTVDVAADADAATLTLGDASGTEDNAIPLSIEVTAEDDIASVSLSGVPNGATLTYQDELGQTQTLTVTDNAVSLTPDQLNGLAITPPANSDEDFALAVSATTTDGSDSETVSGTLNVSVDPEADAPSLTMADVTGVEDTAIALNIDPALVDTDGSESLGITVSDIPAGATMSYVDSDGVTQPLTIANNSVQLTPDQLNGLAITPVANFDGTFDLSVAATSTEADGGDTATTVGTLTVDVTADADGATLNLVDAEGTEDTAIPLNIEVTAEDNIAVVTIADVPTGASLSAGVDNGDGTWTLLADQVDGLTLTPPADSDADFTLTVSAMTTDGIYSTTVEGTLDVSVAADADAPTLTTTAASGDEDAAIALTIDPGLTDTDGSESLSITIGDIPAGATLNYVDGDGVTQAITVTEGSAELTPEQLNGLTITPADNFDGTFDLSVAATSTEADGGDSATTTGTLTVNVAADADEATLTLGDVSGTEDQAISLNIGVTAEDDIANVTLSDIPDGATLTYVDGDGVTQEITVSAGSAELTTDQLNGLSITPPENSDADFTLSVSATTTDGADSATVNGSMEVSVAADADAPTLTTTAASGDEDTAIALTIDPGLTDTDGSESLSITIGDIPDGATLNYVDGDGVTQAITVTDGSAELTPEQLNGLTITPADNFDGSFNLSVSATSTEADGGDAATTTGTLTVDVAADADEATLTLGDVSGTEDQAISLNIGVTADDDIANVTLSDIPDGATLSYVDGDGVTQEITVSEGSAELTTDQLNGLSITPPENSDADFTLAVSATTTDGADSATVNGSMEVSVAADADAPTLEMTGAAGDEDTAIALTIDPGLTDTDGSESLSITIGDIPAGATLNYVDGDGVTQAITVTEGSAELTTEQLNGLTITPADNFDGTFDLSVAATSTEADGGDSATTTGTLTVDVAADADEATLTLGDVSGTEDQAISLNIGVTAEDDIANVTLSDIPDGATLTYVDGDGVTQEITVSAGSAELTTDQLNGLSITPPENSDADFTLSVSATTTDGADSATVNGSMEVSVAADADAPTLTTTAASGDEDTAIALTIDPGLTDTDGSESLSITIGDIPDGATLNYVDGDGVTQAITVTDGSAELTPEQLNGLTITPADNFDGSFNLSVSATSTEADGGDAATTTGTLTVDVAADADEATLTLGDVSGTEDQAISLNIGVTADDDIANVTLSDIPDGATLSYVDGDGVTQEITVSEGSAELTTDQLNGLSITPPENSDADFTLAVSATTTDGADSATVNGSMEVSVAADADAPTLEMTGAAGDEDTAIALTIDPGLTDTDGSESLSITIGDIPAGATLNYVDGDGVTQAITVTEGSAELTTEQLNGLTITPADNFDGTFDLSVAATSTEADGGDAATTTGTLTVDVAADADEATLTLGDVSGTEDQAISLNIGVTAEDDIANVTLSDIPDGATLSYVDGDGVTQEITVSEGSAELTTDQLNGLSITPPENSDADFTLAVSATTTDGSDSATVSGTMEVSVAADADAPTLSVELGEGVVSTENGTETEVSITSSNYAETGSGFTVTARSIENDGTLSEASVDNVSTGGGGFGVSGSASGPDYQLGYDQSTEQSEQLIVDFENDVTEISFDFGRAYANEGGAGADEQGHYEIFRDGVKVGEGDFVSESGNTGTVTVSADDGGPFDQIVFTAADGYDESGTGRGDGSDFVITGIDFTNVEGGDTVVTYPLDITSSLTDTDGSETLSITVDGLPDGAVLSAGTENVDGSWTLGANELEGLEITVGGDDPGQAFDISVTATATETDGGDTSSQTVVASAVGTEVDSTAEGATIDTTDASGVEDSAIALEIDVALIDADGSETASITISGVPDGAVLSAGSENEDGTWTLGIEDLDGLSVTPAANSDADFELTVSVTTTEENGGETTTTVGTLDVSVAADADAPTLTTTAASGDEDTAIALTIDPGLTDTDGSESLSITIGDIPDGATLNYVDGDGVTQAITVTEGSAELTPEQLNGLTITPADNFDGTFDLSVAATSTEADGGDTATTTGTLTVDVAADADEATLTLGDVSGTEDQAISLNIGVTAEDDIANVTLSDIPDGATLSYVDGDGVTQEITVSEGSAELTTDQLNGLSITPPENSDADFTLSVSATTTDGSDSATVSGSMEVSVAADADAPTLTTTAASGDEDTAIALTIDPGLTDTDGSESLSITIGDIPDGATLNYVDGDGATQAITVTEGSAELTPEQLNGLTITPPIDYDGSFDLSVSATSTEADGGDAATTSGTLTVDVAGVDDSVEGSTVETTAASGNEDSAIALDIDVTQLDTDGSETVSITLSDVPDGAVLSNGSLNDDGTWTLDLADLDGLTLTPPADSNEDFQLGVSVTTTEADGGDSSTTTATLDVDVTGVADAPTATVQDETGSEDSWIQLNLDSALGDTDGSESLTITISDVPEGALLAPGSDNGDGTWSVSAAELPDVCILPADNFDGDITMTLNVTSTENDGDTATTSQSFTVTVEADADEATLTLGDVSGTEDQAISLNIGVTADDDIANVTLSDIPDGATLTYVDGDGVTQEITVSAGSAELTTDQLNGLSITPPENSDADFTLSVSATTTDGADSATVSGTMDVSVAADADAPTLEMTGAAGDEDTAIALTIDPGLTDTDGSESLSITIGDIPDGATLNYVDGDGATQAITVTEGSADLTTDQLNGLTITPPIDYDGSFDLSVSATSTEADGGDAATTSGTLTVDVAGVDDSVEGSTVETTAASGNEDSAIALDIDVTQLDTDGSETVSITLSDVPDGAVLSNGSLNDDGTWTLDLADLDGLTITPPADSNEDFQVGVSVTTTEADGGDSTTTTATLDVDVTGVADQPTLQVALGDAEVVTTGGTPVDVTINSDNVNGTDSGFTVTARNIDGNGNLTEASSDNISVHSGSPSGFGVSGGASGADAELGYDDASGQSEQLIISFDQDVSSVDVSVAWQHSGEEAHYELYQDGVKVGEGTFSGITDGVDDVGTFSADGGAAFDQIVFTAPGQGDDFLINSVTFEAYEGGEEVVQYPLDVTSNLTDTDNSETLSITIDGLPDGAALSAGTENADGSWTLAAGDLDGLMLTTAVNAPGFDLQIAATATENDGDTNTVTTTLSVDAYDGSVEGSTLSTTDATGAEDNAIALDIDVTQLDTDGSETVSITISDVPDGAVLSAGTNNNDGTWTLEAGDLDGLTITPPEDSSADFQLSVAVTTTESNGGDSTTTTATLDVGVSGVADAPTLSASVDFTGVATAETDVNVPQSISDVADGNTITVSGVPNGATLSAGTDNGDGSWTLASGDLANLTVTPAEGATDDFSLAFEVTGGSPGETIASDNFADGVSDWSGGAVSSNGQMYLGGDTTATQTFSFGPEHAGQTVTISFDSDAGAGWEESGVFQDYFRVEANDQQVLSTSESSGMSHSITVTLDANGDLKLDMTTDTTASSEGVYVDNLVITSGDDWVSSLATDTVDVTPETGGAIYDLDINAASTDADGSETLSVTVDGLPNGTVLSAGTENPDGSWTLESGDLANLTMTVPSGADDFNLQVSATASEDGTSSSVSTAVTVEAVDLTVEGANLSTTAATGNEDTAIALDIDASLIDTDGSETMSITISDVPSGASLSAGTDNGDGTWTLASGDLDGLTILPPADSSTDFQLGISVTTTESNTGDTSTSTATLDVSVDGVADAPELSVVLGDAVEIGGSSPEPVSYWKLDELGNNETLVDSIGDNDGSPVNKLRDMDGGEGGSEAVFGTAAGFKGGGSTKNQEYIEVDHSPELKPDNGTLTLWFDTDDENNGTLASSDSSGYDSGGHFNLSIDNGHLTLRMQDGNSSHTITSSGPNGTVSEDEWNQVTVSWGEDGLKMFMNGELVASDPSYTGGLSGNDNPWTFGASQMYSGNNVADSMTDFFDGHLDDIAIYDQQLSAEEISDLYNNGVQAVMDAGGETESVQFPLDITTSLTDTDGSESLSITIEGLPLDADLSAGTDNGDGTWSLAENELDGLTVTVPAGTDDFAMTVSATATDEGGDTLTVTEIVPVDVASDGFDADVSGTSGADTLSGSSGADVIDAGSGDDQVDAGSGDDIVMAGAGDDTISGGDGDDIIDGGAGNDTIDGGAGNDSALGGDGNDLFIFGAGDGSDYFDGGDGWSDTVQLEGVDGGPGADAGWALQVEGDIGYTETANGIEFDEEVAGSITLSDGSELTFEGVEKLEW